MKEIDLDVKSVKERVRQSLALLVAKDFDLLNEDASERSVTHRLAVYCESAFDGWNVDCEYNRMTKDGSRVPKTLYIPPKKIDDAEWKERSVFPDIIVHHRKCESLVVIEVKKSSSKGSEALAFDQRKVKAYLMEHEYRFGLLLTIKTDNSIHEPWVETWFGDEGKGV